MAEGDVGERVGGVVGGAAAQPALRRKLPGTRVVALRVLIDNAGHADARTAWDLVSGEDEWGLSRLRPLTAGNSLRVY